jgi:hypothetical protein
MHEENLNCHAICCPCDDSARLVDAHAKTPNDPFPLLLFQQQQNTGAPGQHQSLGTKIKNAVTRALRSLPVELCQQRRLCAAPCSSGSIAACSSCMWPPRLLLCGRCKISSITALLVSAPGPHEAALAPMSSAMPLQLLALTYPVCPACSGTAAWREAARPARPAGVITHK